MKGTYRSVQQVGKPKTNFNDWSDPLLKRVKHEKTVKDHLTKEEKKARLEKFKVKTAYCQTENDIDNIRQMVEQGEPLLHHKEIRLLRLPLYNGLVLNLKDDGYLVSAEYIKELIVLDEMYSKQDSSAPLLRSNETVLDQLARALKLAELAKRNHDTTAEVQLLMEFSLNLMNSKMPIFWLVQELLELCVSLVDSSGNPVDPQVEATLRYIYSLFLLNCTHNLEEAKQLLQLSMNLSKRNSSMTIKIDGEEEDILYLRSCVLLSKIHLEQAYEQRWMDIENSIKSCRISLHWAKQANNQHAIATALLTLADFYLQARQLSPIPDLITEHNKLCKNCLFYLELCEGYVLLSKYHETVGNHEKVIEVIEELISFALDQGILEIVLKAHLKLAEIYGKRRERRMKYHAAAAFRYSKLVGKVEDVEMSQCIMGIVQGNELMYDYLNLVLHSQHLDGEPLKSLIDWKMLKIPFHRDDSNLNCTKQINVNLEIKREIARLKTEHKNSITENLHRYSRASSSLSDQRRTASRLKIQHSNTALRESIRGSSIYPTRQIHSKFVSFYNRN